MKKALIIIGGIVLAAILAGASFYGGMAYQRSQQASTQARFFASRGINGDNQGGNFPTGGRGIGGFGGITGSVKSIDGNVLSVSTAQNVITVNLSDTTKILKASTGAASDLTAGEQVVVSVQRDTSGNNGGLGGNGTNGNGSTGGTGGSPGPIEASQVIILPASQ